MHDTHAVPAQDTRMFFSATLFRVATPYREMSWADFLLADILTSLAKPLSDCERALCHLLSGPVMLPHSTDEVSQAFLFLHRCILILPVQFTAFTVLSTSKHCQRAVW